jgi:hypothetical protein
VPHRVAAMMQLFRRSSLKPSPSPKKLALARCNTEKLAFVVY